MDNNPNLSPNQDENKEVMSAGERADVLRGEREELYKKVVGEGRQLTDEEMKRAEALLSEEDGLRASVLAELQGESGSDAGREDGVPVAAEATAETTADAQGEVEAGHEAERAPEEKKKLGNSGWKKVLITTAVVGAMVGGFLGLSHISSNKADTNGVNTVGESSIVIGEQAEQYKETSTPYAQWKGERNGKHLEQDQTTGELSLSGNLFSRSSWGNVTGGLVGTPNADKHFVNITAGEAEDLLKERGINNWADFVDVAQYGMDFRDEHGKDHADGILSQPDTQGYYLWSFASKGVLDDGVLKDAGINMAADQLKQMTPNDVKAAIESGALKDARGGITDLLAGKFRSAENPRLEASTNGNTVGSNVNELKASAPSVEIVQGQNGNIYIVFVFTVDGQEMRVMVDCFQEETRQLIASVMVTADWTPKNPDTGTENEGTGDEGTTNQPKNERESVNYGPPAENAKQPGSQSEGKPVTNQTNKNQGVSEKPIEDVVDKGVNKPHEDHTQNSGEQKNELQPERPF
jgi:hypothetical protein